MLKLLAVRHSIDVIIVAESPFEGQLDLAGFTEAKTTIAQNRITGVRLEIYHRNTVQFTATEVVERAVLHEVAVQASNTTLLLVSAHLNSKLMVSPETRKQYVRELAADIRRKEATLPHERTVLVGDLNFDPYDSELMDAYYLNAMPSKSVAQGLKRTVRREKIPFFYNPMWAHLSDLVGSKPGTYYRASRDVDCRFWNLVDQVLIRPELLPYWDDADLQILAGTGKVHLSKRGREPDRKQFSDHFPIVFSLRI